MFLGEGSHLVSGVRDDADSLVRAHGNLNDSFKMQGHEGNQIQRCLKADSARLLYSILFSSNCVFSAAGWALTTANRVSLLQPTPNVWATRRELQIDRCVAAATDTLTH